VINDILDFSKIEAGKLTIEVIDFDAREVVESSVEMLAERADKKGIDLACWIEPEVPRRLRGDPVRLRQILINLVSNAVKFTEKGEVLVHVKRLEENPHRLVARFEVRDTGIGIAPEAMARIFQEFTQADGSTTRKYGGTGLGLTISQQLVSLMQGRIGVESTAGVGSTFWFELPFQKLPATEEQPQAPLDALGAWGDLRVLVVESSVTHRRILQQHLQQWKIAHDLASTTAEALRMIQSAAKAGAPYPLLIIDMDLPETDGLSLAQTVKGDPQLATSRIIMVTSLLNRLNTTTMKATDLSACLVKPVRQSRLLDCLVDVMSPSGDVSAQTANADGGTSSRGLVRAASQNVRVLLAEDNVVNQRVVLKQLKKLGFSADSVSNGNEVLAALQRVPYDIIIMDCQMPEMDGYEVTRRIRQSGSDSYIHLRSAPYIIALTANAMGGDRERCLALGMNDYLTKPLHLHDLDAVLQRALIRISLPTESPSTSVQPEPEALDRTVIDGLKELREPGQPDPLRELIELFLRDAQPRLEQLDQAAGASDLARVGAAAHTLKGSASNLGARRLSSLSAALEKQAKAGEIDQAVRTLAEVKSEFSKVRDLLAAELNDESGTR
jgi:CheY-like chemotaxis protein/HPt (histidine-containing phosphotransfer) domain-containing protein